MGTTARLTHRERKDGRTVRTRLYYEQSGHCAFCGNWMVKGTETYDHLIPRSQGGPATHGNGVAACSTCNNAKADTILSDQRHKLRTHVYVS